MPAGQLYDNIAAITVVGLIASVAIYILPTINFQNVKIVDEQQLINIAQDLLNSILLNEGYPENWGSYYPFSEDIVQSFGLALYGANRLYVLDPDKVQRLVEGNPVGYISYERVKSLLNVEGYGFSISIKPPFKVHVEDRSESFQHLIFEVSVSDWNGKAIPGAEVTAVTVYCTAQGNNIRINIEEKRNVTDVYGRSRIEQIIDENDVDNVATVFHVSLHGLNTYTVVYQRIPPQNIADINIVNETIILTQNGVPTPHENVKIERILVYGYEGDIIWEYNGTQHDFINYWKQGQEEPPPGYKLWDIEVNAKNPELVLFVFSANIPGEGRVPIPIVGPNPLWKGYRVTHFGGYQYQQASVTVRRTVLISSMTYIAELTLWKEL